jgi:hypothetical protein
MRLLHSYLLAGALLLTPLSALVLLNRLRDGFAP